MNRSLVVGLGVAAVAVLVGLAAWLLLGGRPSTTTPSDQPAADAGPIKLNLVTVVTDHAASESDDGRKLTITFPSFELSAGSGQTTSAVFSTTWRLKLGADERAVVTSARLAGFMKSAEPTAATPPPAPEPTVSSATPAEAPPATPPADGSATAEPAATPSTTPPSQPATPAPAPKAIAGDGVARVIVTLGNETYVSEWMDATGEGASRMIAKAAALTEAPIDYRNGSTIPVSVTLELSGGHEADAQAKINSLELQLFAESAPQGQPPAEPAPTQPAPPPAEPTTTPPANP